MSLAVKSAARRGGKKTGGNKDGGPPGPTMGELLSYVDRTLEVLVPKLARHLPLEQVEEIEQHARLRVFEASPRIQRGRGWKAFVQRHCRGAILDYLKSGAGFKETAYWLNRPGNVERADRAQDLRERVTPPPQVNASDEIHLEDLVGAFGVFTKAELEIHFQPNWELISRMATVDTDLHVVAKLFLGFTVGEIAVCFNVTPSRISRRISRFFDKLDSPQFYNTPWIKQTIYAFGFWDLFHMDPHDNLMGWDLDPPINLRAEKSADLMRSHLTLVEVEP